VAILHIVQYSLPEVSSGYTFRTHAIAMEQRSRGLGPIVATSPRHPGAGETELDGIPYLRCQPEQPARSPWLRDLRRVRTLATRIVEIAADRGDIRLLHAHSPMLCGMAALRAARRLGLPIVYEARGLWEEAIAERAAGRRLHPRYLLARAFELRVCRQASAVVAISEGLRGHLISRGLPAEHVWVIPNGVDAGAFAPRTPPPGFRRSLGLGEGPLVLYLGALRRYEGLETLLDAWPTITARVPTAHMVIVGDGEHRSRIGERAKTLAPSVVILPPVPHDAVGDFYAAADVVVYPRLSTPATEIVTPLKPLEAMAMGKAILASDVGGLRELLTDGGTARLVRAGSPAALAETCVELLSDAELRDRLGRRAREHVIAHHQWRQVGERYCDLYASVAPDGGTARGPSRRA
jgi:PEP-CTERM/exosortase A-associated glycosyltransferase